MARVSFVNAGAGAGTGATYNVLYPSECRIDKIQMDLCGAAGTVALGSAAVYIEQQIANAGGWVEIGKFSLPSQGHIGGIDTGAISTRALATDTSGTVAGRRAIRFRWVNTTAADELSFVADVNVIPYE